jgi:hypothetical protein
MAPIWTWYNLLLRLDFFVFDIPAIQEQLCHESKSVWGGGFVEVIKEQLWDHSERERERERTEKQKNVSCQSQSFRDKRDHAHAKQSQPKMAKPQHGD